LKATNVKSLEVLKPLKFNYPLEQTANILVKLGVKAENGVGPDGDIVAFSNICQHQGCPVGFLPAVSQGYCSCHGSTYDFTHNGSIITGPTTQPVPRVLLEYDGATGDIYVVGMGPPVIYGQGPLGAADPTDLLKYDLQGGQIVTEISLVPLS
jgi:arsenite oxidase small subunit